MITIWIIKSWLTLWILFLISNVTPFVPNSENRSMYRIKYDNIVKLAIYFSRSLNNLIRNHFMFDRTGNSKPFMSWRFFKVEFPSIIRFLRFSVVIFF